VKEEEKKKKFEQKFVQMINDDDKNNKKKVAMKIHKIQNYISSNFPEVEGNLLKNESLIVNINNEVFKSINNLNIIGQNTNIPQNTKSKIFIEIIYLFFDGKIQIGDSFNYNNIFHSHI